MLQYRKTPRAEWLAYNEGMYFITICTHNRIPYFGYIRDGVMNLSEIGMILDNELRNPQCHHPHIEIPLYTVMPNHLHAIVVVNTPSVCPMILPETSDERKVLVNSRKCGQRALPLLSAYIGSLKSAVTRLARVRCPAFRWQQRYYDHAVRGTDDCNRIVDYIENNVMKWEQDSLYSE